MKFKYYIRGFGTGVLFATVLLMITLAVRDNMPSDKRKQTNSSGNLVIDDVTKQNGTMEPNSTDRQNDTTEKDSTVEQNDTTEQNSTAGQNDTTEPDSTAEQNSTADGNHATSQQGATSQENTVPQETTDSPEPVVPTTEPSSGSDIIFTLSITPGMTSNEAADILASYGIVESGYDFNMYLYKNGYESRLRVGNFQIKAGMSYQEIAEIITR